MSKPIDMRDKAVTDAPYHVTDPDEVALVREALQDTSPRLSGEAAREYIMARLREHGIG